MDRRDDYWGNPGGMIRDSEEAVYGSPSDFEHPTISSFPPHHPVGYHHHPHSTADHARDYVQPQHHRLDHHSSTNIAISGVDVLCGRGKTSFNHVGNKVFRNAVSMVLDDFIGAVNRFEKALVVQRVVDSVQSRGGRFLKEDTRQGGWYQLSDQQSKEKVGHAIRDAANLYEVRKLKEKTAQATPQLKNAGESDDDNRKLPEWKNYSTTGEDETSVDYGVSGRGRRSLSMSSRSTAYTPTDYSSSSKRRGTTTETTDYQPHRKRRRTSSPTMHHSSNPAMSNPFLSTPSPPRRQKPPEMDEHSVPTSSLRQSPILYAQSSSNVVSFGSTASHSRGGVKSNMPASLRRSPIAPEGSDIIPPLPQTQYVHHFTVYDPHQQPIAASSPPEEEPQPSVRSPYGYPYPWSERPAYPYRHGSAPILPPFYDESAYRNAPYPPVPPGHHYPPPPPQWPYRGPPGGWAAHPYNERGSHEERGDEGSTNSKRGS